MWMGKHGRYAEALDTNECADSSQLSASRATQHSPGRQSSRSSTTLLNISSAGWYLFAVDVHNRTHCSCCRWLLGRMLSVTCSARPGPRGHNTTSGHTELALWWQCQPGSSLGCMANRSSLHVLAVAMQLSEGLRVWPLCWDLHILLPVAPTNPSLGPRVSGALLMPLHPPPSHCFLNKHITSASMLLCTCFYASVHLLLLKWLPLA